jgi:serine/threonine-protein kinase
MSIPSACPSPDRLQLLLSGESNPAEQTTLVAHLDECPACQRTLEQLAGAEPALLGAASALLHNTFVEESPLRRVLNDLRDDSTATIVQRPLDRSSWVKTFLKPVTSLEAIGQLGDFEVVEILGQGSMGVVLKANDPALKRAVAIKMLAPDLASDDVARLRFAREGQAAAAVRHPHIVTIHGVSETKGIPFIVMEHVADGSL